MMKKTDLYTCVTKRDGWQARSELRLRENLDGSWLRLEFVTRKHSYGGVVTSASVDRVNADGSSTFWVFQDYSRLLCHTQKRCTENNCRAQHNTIVEEYFDDVLKAVKAQYGL